MEDQKQENLFDGDQPKGDENEQVEDQEVELTEDGDENQQADDSDCAPEEGCEEPGAGDGKGKKKRKAGNGEQPAAASKPAQAPAKSTPAATTFTAPFNVRYASEFLDLAGFTPGQAYTSAQIKQALIDNGFDEFKEIECDFHHSVATNTLVLTIRGSRKGGPPAVKLPLAMLQHVEFLFRATFARDQTEDRMLIYADKNGELLTMQPEMVRKRAAVTCDVDDCIERDGLLWDLAFDLHSHHVMGAFWSSTDNANERLKGPVYGVFSWKNGDPKWLFRRSNGREHEDLLYGEVVTGG